MSIQDARRDYVGTVVMHKGVPVYILNIDDDFLVLIRPLMGKREKTITSKELFLTKPPERLGMINLPDRDCAFIVRIPFRRYQIGISNSNIQALRMSTPTKEHRASPAPIGASLITQPYFADTILGNYPKFQEALRLSIEKKIIVAFDRQFAVGKGLMFYKDYVVGLVPLGATSFNDVAINSGFEYVKKAYKGV